MWVCSSWGFGARVVWRLTSVTVMLLVLLSTLGSWPFVEECFNEPFWNGYSADRQLALCAGNMVLGQTWARYMVLAVQMGHIGLQRSYAKDCMATWKKFRKHSNMSGLSRIKAHTFRHPQKSLLVRLARQQVLIIQRECNWELLEASWLSPWQGRWY